MATNSRQANSSDDIDKVSRSIDYVADIVQNPGSIQSVLSLATTQLGTTEGVHVRPMLQEMIDNVDRPLLKDMAQDVVTVMSNWFEDPEVLCCLVRGIYNFASVNASDDVPWSESEFAKYIDILIAFVDIIITMLSANVKKLNVAIPDFISDIMTGVMGAVLLVLQEVLFTIKDSVIKLIIDEINYYDKENDAWWAKCLPLAELFEVLRKYTSDYGLFAELFEKIKGHIGQMVGAWDFYKKLNFPPNIKDLEFLMWFRELLVKLKTATINFDLCFSAEYQPVGSVIDPRAPSRTIGESGSGNGWSGDTDKKTTSNPDRVQGINIASDGTILQDKNSLVKQGTTPVLTNSSIRGFLNKYYGYPLDVVDSILVGATSADSVQGTDTGGNLNLNADCPNSPTPAETIQWALRVRNRNL